MKFNIVVFSILFSFLLSMGAYFPVPLTSHTVPGLVTKTLPAIVELRPGFSRWLGAGVLVSEDGWIMTARHIVEDQEVMVVTMPDRTKHMSINIVTDPNSDIAILKIDVEDAPYVHLRPDYPQQGEPVFVIGHPLGIFNTISLGIVSNVRISKPPYDSEAIITDAEVTHGNSGGGLFDMEGRLLGIVVAGSQYFTGMEQNIVVPVARGRKLLDEYLQQQETSADPNSVDVSDLQPCG